MQVYYSFEKELWNQTKGASLNFCRFERFLDEPVVRNGPKGSPDEHLVQCNNVIRENNEFTMWYVGMRPPGKDIWRQEHAHKVCIAKSADGIVWEKPNLKLEKVPCGGAPNNVLPNLHHFYNAGVIKDGDGYVMQLMHSRGLKKEEGQTTFSIYTSADGIHWEGKRKPCIKVQHFEAFPSIFKFKDTYYVLGQGVSPFFHMPDGSLHGRVMYGYYSRDLKTWTQIPGPLYSYPIPKYFPRAGLQVHVGASVKNRGRILIGFMGQFWPAGFTASVRSTFGLIYSYDAQKWTEPFVGEPLLLPDEKGWDCGMLIQGNSFHSQGDKSYYWYDGLDGGNWWSSKACTGLVRMRRDGFSYFAAEGKTRVTIETAPVDINRDAEVLYLNVSASQKSPVTVSLLSGRKKEKIASTRIVKSGVMVRALNLKEIRSRANRYILRFTLTGNSKLYSFNIGKDVNVRKYLAEWR